MGEMMQPKRSVQPTQRFLGLAPLLAAGIVIVILAVALRTSFGGSAGASPSPSTPPTPAPGSLPPQVTPPSPPALLPLPEGLTNRTWVTLSPVEGVGYVAGTLDGRARLVLPEGESPLAASDGRVLSVRYGPVAASGLATSSTVIVRDVASGKVIVEVELPGAISNGVMDADTAYVAAEYTEVPGEVPAVDAISLADGSVREVISPRVIAVDPKDQNPWNAVHRGPRLVLSPSGTTLGSCVWLKNLCAIETLDLGTGTLTRAVTGIPAGLGLLSEAVLVAVGDGNTSGYDAATGKLLWTLDGARAMSAYLSSDASTLILAYENESGNAVVSVDLRSGARRELLRTPNGETPPHLWAEASNDLYAVLVPYGGDHRPPEEVLAGAGSVLADLLDLSTGKIEPAALRVTGR